MKEIILKMKIVFFISLLFISVNTVYAQALTKEKIQAALDEAYNKFKDVKE